jgi:hypothetical protein
MMEEQIRVAGGDRPQYLLAGFQRDRKDFLYF